MFDRQLHIAVIDDDAGDVELLGRRLASISGLTFELCRIADPKTAVDRIARQTPDIVFVDFNLGSNNGLDVVEAIRASGNVLPMIMLTGQGSETLATDCLRSGADDYVIKNNASSDTLRRAIEHAGAQHARRKAEAELRLIRYSIDRASDAVFWVRDDGRFIYINDTACEISGYDREELLSLTVPDIMPAISRQDRPDLSQQLDESRGLPPEGMLRRKDGSTFPAEIKSTFISFQGTQGTCVFVRDISDRKQAAADREALHARLVEASRNVGMAEVATGVLHNVGNVLNSVNVSSNLLMEKLRGSRVGSLTKAADVISQHQGDLTTFLANDARGRHFPRLLKELATNLSGERDAQLEELRSLVENIEHVKEIINTQQSYARLRGTSEPVNLVELVEDALKINDAAFVRHRVEVIREFVDVPPIVTEKHKVLQIVVNLINNAKYAVSDSQRHDKTVTVSVAADDESVRIQVRDNGIGIPSENLTKIFSHGFTTRKDGHGFGLHSSALTAQELGGTISAHSDGRGSGATFTLSLPFENRALTNV